MLKLFQEQLKVKNEDHFVSNCENVTDNDSNLEGKKRSLGHNSLCCIVHIPS